jgi:hypothetical protein
VALEAGTVTATVSAVAAEEEEELLDCMMEAKSQK